MSALLVVGVRRGVTEAPATPIRRWILHLGLGSYPVVVNGWSLSRVARYERSYVWHLWYGRTR